jgi:hypothetical protein
MMDESVEIELQTENAGEVLSVFPLGGGRFRLEVTPAFGDLDDVPVYAADVIEAEPVAPGIYRFVRVAERAPFQHFSFGIPLSFADSEEFRGFCDDVIAADGGWERVFGGILYVHVPLDSAFDVARQLERRMTAATPPGSDPQPGDDPA